MIVVLNEDGTIQNISPSTLIQGQNNASKITAICPSMSQATVVEIGFVLPTGDIMEWNIPDSENKTAYVLMNKVSDAVIGGNSYPVYEFTVQGCLTNYPGTLEVYFNISDILGNTTSYQVDVTVEESIATEIYEQEEVSSLAYILSLVSSIEDKVDIAQGLTNANKFVKTDAQGRIASFSSTVSISELLSAATNANKVLIVQEDGTIGYGTLSEGQVVIDNLTSTSTTQALSANQGKNLNDKKVDVNEVQNLTSTQKAQARENIGAGTSNFSGDYDDLSNKPSLSTVATSGDYDDLLNKPTDLSDFTNDLAVSFEEQTLTSAQKNQVVDNLSLKSKFLMQLDSMPSASDSTLNWIVMYTGDTSETFTNGLVYKTVSSGNPVTYSWQAITDTRYVDLTSEQIITGAKDFRGGITKNGNDIMTTANFSYNSSTHTLTITTSS